MITLDIFKNSIFNLYSLTASINKIETVPGQISKMGLFVDKPITKTTAIVEERNGKLNILKTSPRGTTENIYATGDRKAKAFIVPHIDAISTILADDLQNIRAFGSETELETVAKVVNDRMQEMKAFSFDPTVERWRQGALNGVVLDRDGEVIYNYFTEFGIAEQSVNADFTDVTFDAKIFARKIKNKIEDTLGMQPYTGIVGVLGDDYFDAFVTHPSVKEAFARWQDGEFLRTQQDGIDGFHFAGITWVNIRSSQGWDIETARFFPLGVPDLFQSVLAPADFMETVNTLGQPYYAKTKTLDYDKGVNIYGQRNSLEVCTQPAVLIKSVASL